MNNATQNDYDQYDNYGAPPYDLMYHLVIPRLVPLFYCLVSILGAAGNLLVIVVFGLDSHNRDSTNALIINLAICDLMFIVFCVPPTAINYATNQWPFGAFVCGSIYYLMHCSVLGSMWTLVLLTVDRFLAIALPLRSKPWRSVKNAVKVCCVMWLCVSILCIPVTTLYQQTDFNYNDQQMLACVYKDYMNQTAPVWEVLTYHLTFSVGGYLIPLSACLALNIWMIRRLRENPFWSNKSNTDNDRVHQANAQSASHSLSQFDFDPPIPRDNKLQNYDGKVAINSLMSGEVLDRQRSVLYLSKPLKQKKDRMKKRVLHMITLVCEVSFVFGMCWLPMNVIYIIYGIRYKRVDGGELISHDKTIILSAVAAQVMAYMNSALNPILYGFMSSNFRRGATNVLNKICCQHNNQDRPNQRTAYVPVNRAKQCDTNRQASPAAIRIPDDQNSVTSAIPKSRIIAEF